MLFASFSLSVHATHLVGADISYTSLGGNVYRVELTFYRDCQGSPAPLGVGIEFRSASCGQYFTDTLLQVIGTGNEITYPCPTQAHHVPILTPLFRASRNIATRELLRCRLVVSIGFSAGVFVAEIVI